MSKLYTPHWGGSPRPLEKPAAEGLTRCDGTTVPTGAGYEHGCVFRKKNGTTAADALYVNIGSVTSCNFQLIATTTDQVALAATAAEINRTADVSDRIVTYTSTALALTVADHEGKTIVLDRAAGIQLTLPLASAANIGAKFRVIIKTTFTGAATVGSGVGTDFMIGHALMGNNSDNTVVDWPAVISSSYNQIDMLGTANSTGGMAGQSMTFEVIAAGVWYVEIRGDAAGTEATPFVAT